jgi:hypothetical protein
MIALCGIGLTSCYTRKEGCIDTLASNFDVTSDDACTKCCKFPKIILKIDHFAGDSVFNNQTVYINQYDQKYQLQDIRYYLSSVKLFQKNNTYTIAEEITTDNGDKIKDDVKICRLSDSELVFGTQAAYGKFDSLIFYSGLNSNYFSTEFPGVTSDHVLYKNNRLKNPLGQYVQCTFRILVMGTEQKILNLSVSADIAPIKIVLDSCVTTTKGSDIIYGIKSDYLKLLDNVKLDLSPSEIEKGAEKNFGRIFRVK